MRSIRASLFLVAMIALTGCQMWPMQGFARRDKSRPDTESRDLLPVENRIDLQLTIAESLSKEGQTEAAAKIYEGVLQLDNRNASACHKLAVCYDRLGRTDVSTAFYQKALTLNPSNADLQCDYGYSCSIRGNLSLAEEHLLRALELRRDFPRAQVNLGMVLARTGREAMALQAFERAGLSAASAHNNLAFALSLDNRFPEAAEQYALALQADANLAQAQHGAMNIQKVLNAIHTAGPQASEVQPVAFQYSPDPRFETQLLPAH